MHEAISPNNLTAIDLPDALVSQADPEGGPAWAEASNDITADPRFIWRARPWRNYDPLRIHLLNFIERHLIISVDQDLGAELSKILHQVVGE